MLDSLAGEFIKPLLGGRKQRLVTVAFLVSLVFAGIEASTQSVSSYLLNRRIETTARLLDGKDLDPKRRSELLAIQATNVSDLVAINDSLRNPSAYWWRLAKRFAKGVWPVAPFALLIAWLCLRYLPKTPEQGRLVMASLGWTVFCAVMVFGVANGLISAYWNTSSSRLVSIFIFPFASACALGAMLALSLFLDERETAAPAPAVPAKKD